MKFSLLILTLSVLNFNLLAEDKKPARSLDIDPFEDTKTAPSSNEKEVGPKVLAIVENGDKVTAFELEALDNRLSSKGIEKLSSDEQFKAVDAIVLKTEKEGKELKVVNVTERSLDQDEATSACLRRRSFNNSGATYYQPTVVSTSNGSTVYYYQTTTTKTTRVVNAPAVTYSQPTTSPGQTNTNKPIPAPSPDENYYRPGNEFNTQPSTPAPEQPKQTEKKQPVPQPLPGKPVQQPTPQPVSYNTQYTCMTTVTTPSGRVVRYYYR